MGKNFDNDDNLCLVDVVDVDDDPCIIVDDEVSLCLVDNEDAPDLRVDDVDLCLVDDEVALCLIDDDDQCPGVGG